MLVRPCETTLRGLLDQHCLWGEGGRGKGYWLLAGKINIFKVEIPGILI